MQDATRERFAKTADRVAALQDARAAELEERVRRFVQPAGDERALDVGTGTRALALALAPHVREVVGVDLVPELLERARERAAGRANVRFEQADATRLPYADGFRRDLTGTEVRVGGELRRVVGTISMDSFAVELDRELPVGSTNRRTCSSSSAARSS